MLADIYADEAINFILDLISKCRLENFGGKREKFSRKYAFSCMIDCSYCDSTLTRRKWHSGTKYGKTTWQCVTSTKKGKRFCPNSKGIPEEAIEKAILESYRIMCNNKDVLEYFWQ